MIDCFAMLSFSSCSSTQPLHPPCPAQLSNQLLWAKSSQDNMEQDKLRLTEANYENFDKSSYNNLY